jgi:hypothetical protein
LRKTAPSEQGDPGEGGAPCPFGGVLMTYRIDEQSGNIDVRVEKTGADDAEFLAALARCRDGRCECPTAAYDKLEDVRIERDVRGISVHLEAKPGQSISQEAVATCLDYTLRGKK